MIKKIQFITILCVGILTLNGCMIKEYDDVIPECQIEKNGLSKDINKLVPADILQKMIDLGMPINKGGKPPKLEGGTYKVSKLILLSSNIAVDQIGKLFADYIITFSQQNNNQLQIKVDYINGPNKGVGIGSFIVGTDNSFSVFSQIDIVDSAQALGVKAKTVQVMSGTLTPTGIENFHVALFMIDDGGDPNGLWIENGQGRVFKDEDGFSEKI